MSNFGINLDLKLNGQTSLDRAIRGAETLEKIVNRLKDTPLDLSNIGGAARLDAGKLGQARKDIIAFAKDLAKQEKPLANTEAGIREYVSAFNQLAANTKAGTPAFNAFVGVLAKAEKELDGVARATENARRAQQGMMSLEEREAQLEKRSSTLRVLRAKKKLKDEETASRKKNAREMEREAKAQERLNKQNERAEKSRRKRKFTDIAAGVGFPLLFGGGPGSVAGGALGGIFGGMGGSVLGGAIGQQLDKLGGFLIKTGEALNKPIEQFEEIIKLTGSFGREIGGQQGLLKSLELTEVAALQASQAFEEVYGAETTNGLKDLSTAATEFQDTMTRLGIQLTAFSVGPLAEFLRQVSGALPKGRSEQLADEESELRKELKPLQEALAKGLKFTESRQAPRGFFETQQDTNQKRLNPRQIKNLKQKINQIEGEINEKQKERVAISEKLTERLKDQAKVSEILKKQFEAVEEIDKRRTQQEEMRLTARRDTLATFSAGTEIKQAELELSKIKENLRASKELQKQPPTDLNFDKMKKNEGDIIQLQQDEIAAQENLNKLRAKGSNDELLARRAISKDELQAMNNIKKTTILRQQSFLKEFTFNKGREASFEGELLTLRQKFDLEEEIALSKNKQLLESVNELEVKAQLVKLHEQEADLRRRNFEAAERITRESQAQFNIAKAEREQQAASRLQESQNRFELNMAQSQITPVGFFTESQKSIDIRELETELNLERESLKIANMRKNLRENGVNLSEQERINRQFAIDQAVIQFDTNQKNLTQLNEQLDLQDRYRDSLALTTPVVDSLFESLTAVVDGTKSAQEAFADFLNAMSRMLIDTAKQMIATYIAIGIAKMFAGMGGGGSAPAPDIQTGSGFGLGNQIMVGGMRTAASGKGALMNQPYVVGERGPELFVPRNNGTIVPNHQMGGGANVTVNVDASGSSVEGDSDQASQLGKMLGSAVQAELIKQKRPGGLLAS